MNRKKYSCFTVLSLYAYTFYITVTLFIPFSQNVIALGSLSPGNAVLREVDAN